MTLWLLRCLCCVLVATEPSHSLPGPLLCGEQDGIETSHLTAPGHWFTSCTHEGRYSQETYMNINHVPSSMQTLAFDLLDLKGCLTQMAKKKVISSPTPGIT